ncbi:predicted protein [Coccidioides posadasii str. Silveira]|uniref:Predicted protein n=1 Tax=Coccidioides posadasii (strain RMSCC 757 / Silveira) TaxID=443226 RepID=E9CSM1_COCPS|nr:predicted protein [Coccidioides posadasii str. Silveira]
MKVQIAVTRRASRGNSLVTAQARGGTPDAMAARETLPQQSRDSLSRPRVG